MVSIARHRTHKNVRCKYGQASLASSKSCGTSSASSKCGHASSASSRSRDADLARASAVTVAQLHEVPLGAPSHVVLNPSFLLAHTALPIFISDDIAFRRTLSSMMKHDHHSNSCMTKATATSKVVRYDSNLIQDCFAKFDIETKPWSSECQ